jgi:hypothetical protein
MTRGTTVKMIQLSTLTLLLAAGLSGSAWASTPTAEPNPPAMDSAPRTPQTELAQLKPQEEQARTYYVWDRVGKPLGKETFLI